SGVISGQIVGVLAQGASASLDNFGVISANAAGGAGAELDAGGFVTNESGATLSGTAYGVFIGGGTVANAGTISGASYAVKFTGTNAANRLIVEPGAAFSGAIGGADSGNNTLEFANGTTGTLNGVSGGSGTATPTSGTAWSFFHNFSTIAVDAGANWTFNGSNTVSELTDNGTVGISGSLDLSSIDPASTGVFALGGATLEVASALGTDEQIAFSANSDLTVDDTASFGINVGTGSYQGPTLQDFASGDSIDLKNFASAGATSSYDSSTGLLQIGNGTSHATLHFANATLGSGSFQVASDGGTGTSILLG
ncbi:MAG TPA: hypothetical protein VFL55_00350, partial [Acetobacteraceae bacterium]|nr:hypothetical protein [Acetobacteraceae bacterium]